MTRRGALLRGAGLVVAGAALASIPPARMLEAAAAQAAESPDAPILVSLCLDGGNDGLNTLVPLLDPRYRELRRRVAIAPETTLPLAGVAEFGWHPSLGGLRTLYDRGQVAVLPAVDFTDPDQSHFTSAAYWRTGIVGPSRDRTGWLGRLVDLVGSPDNPLQAVSVSDGLDPVLRSRRLPVASVADPASFAFWIPGVWGESAFLPAFREASGGVAGSEALGAARAAYRNAITTSERLRPLRTDDDHPLPPVPVPYPDTDLGRSLRGLARLIGAGLGTRVAAVQTGGFDTHDEQPAEHARLLRDLGDSLLAWQADLAARGLARRVLTLVWSEFGRRPADNESEGTDHGAGGLALVVGERANGGIRSEFPGLARLDDDDNLLVSTDFRTVYATLLESFLGVEAGRVLPRSGPGRLDLVRPA